MMTAAGAPDWFRGLIDLPSTHEARRYGARRLTAADGAALAALHQRAADYVAAASGQRELRLSAFDLSRPEVLVIGALDARRTLAAAVELHLQGSVWHLELMLVDPAHRNAGLGAALYQLAESGARKHGCRSITLTVTGDNAGALRFWPRLGFKPAGTAAGLLETGARREKIISFEKGLVL